MLADFGYKLKFWQWLNRSKSLQMFTIALPSKVERPEADTIVDGHMDDATLVTKAEGT
jgi:hypothetical protein